MMISGVSFGTYVGFGWDNNEPKVLTKAEKKKEKKEKELEAQKNLPPGSTDNQYPKDYNFGVKLSPPPKNGPYCPPDKY